MKIPGTLYQATHEQLDDIGCYCYQTPKFDKSSRSFVKDVSVPVGAVMMYIRSSLHKALFEDEEGETQFENIWFDVFLYKDKFVEFDPEDEVVVPLNIEEL